MKRFLLAAFLAAAGLCAAKAVPEIKPFFFVEEGQCSKYEYPHRSLTTTGARSAWMPPWFIKQVRTAKVMIS